MSEHSASVQWTRRDQAGNRDDYSRDHRLGFENGQVALGSAAADYGGNNEALNPETLLLAALASCHMLTFLAIAAKRGYVVENYSDHATGQLGKNADRRMSVSHCQLRPRVVFAVDRAPDASELARLHAKAHEHCFIANTLRSEVSIES